MKILLPVDGSEQCRKTLMWAANTFDKTSTEYYLINVVTVQSGYVPMIPDALPLLPDPDILQAESEAAMILVRDMKSMLESLGCQVTQSEFALGDAMEKICEYAEAWQVDQVVIGSHGKGGLEKFLMGSVSSDVMKHCKKPVLLFRNVQPVKKLVFHS